MSYPLCGALLGLALWCADMGPAAAQAAEWVVRIDVDDRSETNIDLAARAALESALLSRSGDRRLLEHPTVAAALAAARTQLSLYQFERVDNRNRFVAHIDKIALDQLIRSADGTVWADDRPPVLLWLVVDDVEGRRFGNGSSEEMIWQALESGFDALGVNLRRPLYDLPDALLVSPETLWQRDFGPVIEASARYGIDHLLLGRLVPLSGGRFIAEWIYRDASIERSTSLQAPTVAAAIEPGLELAMAEMRQQFAVSLSNAAASASLQIRIGNVVSLADYEAVTAAIGRIQTLERVRPLAVDGDVLTLELFGIGDLQTLARLTAGNKNLRWVSDADGRDDTVTLLWQDL